MSFILFRQNDPRQKQSWTRENEQRQDGKVFIVTGGSEGIGLAFASSIAQKGGHVVIASRSVQAMQRAVDKIKESGAQGKVEAMHLDLCSFSSIVEFANAFKQKGLPLHVLVENAGVVLQPEKQTKDGLEPVMQVNYWGHFLLAHMLLDKLIETSTDGGDARIVVMSSMLEQLGSVPWEDLEGLKGRASRLKEIAVGSFPNYCNSKLMLIMMARELNKRLKGTGVEAFAAHPGLTQTSKIVKEYSPKVLVAYPLIVSTLLLGQSPWRASLCLERPATDPILAGYGGAYFGPPFIWIFPLNVDNAGMREPGNRLTRDEVAWKHLYQRTLQGLNKKLKEKGLPGIQPAGKD